MKLSPAWRFALSGLVLALVALLACYWGTAASIVEIWTRSETFAHGYVVPLISLWLIWRRRAELAALTPRPSPLWLLGFAPLGLLWLMGDFVAANAVVQFAFAFMLILLVPLLLGTEVARRIAFPLGFLLFAVPFGDFLTPMLMEQTADFTVAALRLTGIPVYREGQTFVIPSGTWSVVQACSGIRYLMASVMVGTLFGYLNYNSYRKRWVFLGVSIVTPVVANWLRAYMIVMLGHLSGNRLAVGVDHLIYGWIFFGIIMFAMFMIGSRWTDPEPAIEPPRGDSGPLTALSARPFAIATALSLLALVLPVLLRGQAEAQEATRRPELVVPALAGWERADASLPAWTPDFEHAAATSQTQWRKGAGVPVGLYVGYYRHQGRDSKLVTSTNLIVNPESNKVWNEAEHGQLRVQLGGETIDFHTAELRAEALMATVSSSSRLRVWQIYWINGHLISSAWQAKLLGAWQRLMGQGDDAAVVMFYTLKSDGADARLTDFVQGQWPTLDTWMRGVRDRGRSR